MEPDAEELRKLARKRVQARVGFVSHLMLYAAVNAGLVMIWAITDRGYPWFIWPLVCWGAAVVVHGVMLRRILSMGLPLASSSMSLSR